jgi:hypothetical protein
MSEQKFPDLPDPTELPRRRLLSPCCVLVDRNRSFIRDHHSLATLSMLD